MRILQLTCLCLLIGGLSAAGSATAQVQFDPKGAPPKLKTQPQVIQPNTGEGPAPATEPAPSPPPPPPAAPPAKWDAPTPIFEYFLAFIATAGVMVLVCMPARRS